MAGPKLNKLKRVSLQQTSVLVFSGIAAIVFLSLLTYKKTDCGFFRHDSECIITNKAGSVGAYLSEFLFSSFGYLSYMIPVGLLMVGIIMFRFPHKRNPHNPRGGINAVLSVAGMIATLIAGSGLSTLLFPLTDLTHSGGGLIGVIVARIFRMFFGDYGSTLILLSIFFAGITLMADIQWGKIVEAIGDKVIQLFDSISGGDEPIEATAGASIPHDRKESADAKDNPKVAGDLGIKDLGLKGVAYLSAAGAGVGALLKQAQGKKLSAPPSDVGGKDTYHDEDKDFLLASINQPVPTAQTSAPVVGSVSLPDDLSSLPSEAETAIDARVEAKPLITRPKLQPKSESKLSQMLKKPPARALNKAVSLPPLSLLSPPPEGQGDYDPKYLDNVGENIIEALGHYGVRGVTVEQWYPGPVVTRYELQLNAGTKVSKVSGLAKDLARNLGVHSVRVVEVIPGKTTIGIEVPNDKREMVTIGSVLESDQFNDSESSMTLALGKDISGIPVVADLGKMPHLLVAGTTGAGKSVAVNVMLVSMLYKSTAEEVRLILIDPKMLELSIYEDIPHLLTPVVTDMKNAANSLRWCVAEMERRYLLMSKLKVRNLAGYNQKVKDAIDRGEPIMDPLFDPTKALDPTPKALEPMPHIVIVVDEFADMMMVVGKKVEELIARIAQKARAAGMHLILATQRPSVDVITGLIKANIPSRIAFNVSTKIDSRTILDQGGAEQLLGLGDMLYLPSGSSMPNRIHGAFVSDQEVEDIVSFVKTQGEPDYVTSVIEEASGNSDAIPGLEPLSSTETETDPLYDEGVAIVTESRRASISYLQRRLKVGYNRAATMIEDMEAAGVVSAVQSNGTREVIAPPPVTD